MLEAVTPVAVAPVALPGPQTWPSVPKLPEAVDCAWPDCVLEDVLEGVLEAADEDELQAARGQHGQDGYHRADLGAGPVTGKLHGPSRTCWAMQTTLTNCLNTSNETSR